MDKGGLGKAFALLGLGILAGTLGKTLYDEYVSQNEQVMQRLFLILLYPF